LGGIALAVDFVTRNSGISPEEKVIGKKIENLGTLGGETNKSSNFHMETGPRGGSWCFFFNSTQLEGGQLGGQ